MKITLITVGTLKEDYLRRAMEEYVRRIGALATWEEINLKEEKLKDESPASVKAALRAEGERILAVLPKDAMAVALCVEGKQYSSEELAALVGRAEDEKGKLCLVIGSSWGLAEEVKAACHVLFNKKVSRGKGVIEACHECGFYDYSSFYRLYKKRFGKAPTE